MSEGEPRRHLFSVSFEPPDVVRMVLEGDLDGPEVVAATKEVIACAARSSEPFLLADVRRLGSISPAGRRASLETSKDLSLHAIAVIGASFHVRVLSTLLIKSMRLLNRNIYELGFFATEDEAMGWLSEHRAQIRGGR
jgi:hypothetical protein